VEIPGQRLLAGEKSLHLGSCPYNGLVLHDHTSYRLPTTTTISLQPPFSRPHPFQSPPLSSHWVHRVAIRFVLLGLGFGTYSRSTLSLCCFRHPAPCLGSCTSPFISPPPCYGHCSLVSGF